MSAFKEIRVDLRSIKGIRRAERLKGTGWTIVGNSLDLLIFQKPSRRKAE